MVLEYIPTHFWIASVLFYCLGWLRFEAAWGYLWKVFETVRFWAISQLWCSIWVGAGWLADTARVFLKIPFVAGAFWARLQAQNDSSRDDDVISPDWQCELNPSIRRIPWGKRLQTVTTKAKVYSYKHDRVLTTEDSPFIFIGSLFMSQIIQFVMVSAQQWACALNLNPPCFNPQIRDQFELFWSTVCSLDTESESFST